MLSHVIDEGSYGMVIPRWGLEFIWTPSLYKSLKNPNACSLCIMYSSELHSPPSTACRFGQYLTTIELS